MRLKIPKIVKKNKNMDFKGHDITWKILFFNSALKLLLNEIAVVSTLLIPVLSKCKITVFDYAHQPEINLNVCTEKLGPPCIGTSYTCGYSIYYKIYQWYLCFIHFNIKISTSYCKFLFKKYKNLFITIMI